MSIESNSEANSSSDSAGETVATPEISRNKSGNFPQSGGTLKQAINKEIETLIQSYIDYAKNVDL